MPTSPNTFAFLPAIEKEIARDLLQASGNVRTTEVQGHANVEIVRHALAFRQPELADVESVV